MIKLLGLTEIINTLAITRNAIINCSLIFLFPSITRYIEFIDSSGLKHIMFTNNSVNITRKQFSADGDETAW